MNYPWLDEYCASRPHTQKDYKEEWEATRYMVDGKMFAMQGGDKEGRAIITLKLEPEYGAWLRQQFSDIVPGYYMNKEHWNSLYLEGGVPDEIVRDMVDRAYRLIFSSLSRKRQKELAGE